MVGLIVLGVASLLAIALGTLYSTRNGRMRAVASPGETQPIAGIDGPSEAPLSGEAATIRALVPEPGERATLLQFSSAFCAPCRVTRRILAEVAEVVPGVTHVEVDAESHLDAVRALGVMRTPTTLILDGRLGVLARASGAPKRDEVMATLAGHIAGPA